MQELSSMYSELGISKEVLEYGKKIEEKLKERFEKIDETAEYNQLKVIHAMQKHKVSEACLYSSSGYGYNDLGRDTLEEVYAEAFHAEAALYALKLRVERMRLQLPYLEIYVQEMSYFLRLENRMIH